MEVIDAAVHGAVLKDTLNILFSYWFKHIVFILVFYETKCA
jgi:hypothetical protein